MSGAVYRHFSKTGELLYVGYSANPFTRLQSHKSQSSWFKEISKITIEWFDTAEEAIQAELIAIKTECPRENVKDMPDDLFLKRKIKRKIERPFESKKPHAQLDAFERVYRAFAGCWSYHRAGFNLDKTNEIRESGRELLASEVIALKESFCTTYKKLEQIGIHKRNEG